jgi:hypothetical protein
MDQETGEIFTDRLMNKERSLNYTQETTEDPMDKIISSIESIQQQLTEINTKLEGEN